MEDMGHAAAGSQGLGFSGPLILELRFEIRVSPEPETLNPTPNQYFKALKPFAG